MFGTREENWVSTTHVLSMRSYAHTQAKHAKRDFLVKTCYFTPLMDLIQGQVSHINQPTCLLSRLELPPRRGHGTQDHK